MEVAIVWCLVWGAVGAGAQTPATMGAGLTPMVPTTQNLQSALFSIDERLRALDSYHSMRYGGRWDVETYVRRLESIETRIGRMETLVELRTDKLMEAIASYQMKDTQTKEHINRKIDSLYDRLIHRVAYMENRVDADVAKIQSSIESGFVRISRAERESEIVEVETQLHDLQRQFEDFERNQNQTLTLLTETFARGTSGGGKTVLNDENADRETFKKDMDQFSTSMENVATKVNKMFNDLNHQSQTLEGLVKNSMSLTNATRREIQEGFKTLGHRKIVMQQGNKQNKEKEAASSLEGWDALSNLLSKEFGNLVRKIDSNYEELTKDHNLFIDGCHRVQENESQLEAEIASVLERILDRIHNRSHDMEKQVVALQEMLKSHNSNVIRTIGHSTNTAIQSTQYTKQLEATILQAVGEHRGLEKLSEGLTNVLAGIKVLQNQLGESPPPNVPPVKDCPDESAIAQRILEALGRNQTGVILDTDAIADRLLTVLKCTQMPATDTRGTREPSDDYVERIVERTIHAYRNQSETHARRFAQTDPEDEAARSECPNGTKTSDEGILTKSHVTTEPLGPNANGRVLDIPANEEHFGDTLEYNVTDADRTPPIQTADGEDTSEETRQTYEDDLFAGGTETPPDYDFEKGSSELDRSEHIYYDELSDEEEQRAVGMASVGGAFQVTVDSTQPDTLNSSTNNSDNVESHNDIEVTVDVLNTVNSSIGLPSQHNRPTLNSPTNNSGKVENHNDIEVTVDVLNSSVGPPSQHNRPTLNSSTNNSDNVASHNDIEMTVNVLDSSVGLPSFVARVQPTNTTQRDTLNNSKNNGDSVENHDDKLFVPDQTGTRGEMENTAGPQTSDPLFSKFWNRVVSMANVSTTDTQTADLSQEGETEREVRKVDGNVNGESDTNVMENLDDANDLDSEPESEDLLDEFGSYVPPSR